MNVPTTAPGLHIVRNSGTAAEDTSLSVIGSTAFTAGSGDTDWTTKAVCASQDPDLLFVTGAAQREAARMCDGCPVKLECLADALDNQVEFGVWGGLTERQRRAILRRSPDVTSWHDVLMAARDNATAATAG